MLDVVAAHGAGLRRDAHAGRAPHDAGRTRATTTSSPRSATSSPSGSTSRARPASPTRALCARPRHRVRQDRRAQPRAARATSTTLVGAVDVPVLVGTSRKWFLGVLLAATRPTPPTAATTARSPPSCGPSTTARRVVRVHDVRSTARAVALLRRDDTSGRGVSGRRERAAGPRGSSRGASAGSSRTASPRRNARAASPATTARCAARRS